MTNKCIKDWAIMWDTVHIKIAEAEVSRNGYWSYLYLGGNHIRSNWGNNFICYVK